MQHWKTIMKTTQFARLALLILTLPAARGEPFRTDINPALLYYQAFLLAPDPMSDADRNYLESKKGKEEKLPERFGQILSAYDNQSRMVRQAAHATVPCDWGVDLSAGPNTLLPHLGRARKVVQTAQLRAVWDLQHGRPEDARDELLASFVLGRNAGKNGLLIGALVQCAIEGQTYGTVAQHFGEFPPQILKELEEGFDAAPARCPMAACIPTGKYYGDWTLRKFQELQKAYPNDDAKVMAGLREMVLGVTDHDTNLWSQIIAASGGTSEEVVKLLGEVDSLIPRAAELMALPQPEYEIQTQQFFAECQKSPNPCIAKSVIGWEKSRPREFRAQAQLAMVHAAVEYKLHGESGFKNVMDPFGNGSFGFQRFLFKGVDRGFELKSAYASADAPFVMIFVEKQGAAFEVIGPDVGKAIDK
jgi:hypothetical protein